MDSPSSTPSAPLSPSTTMTSTHSDTTAAMHDNPHQSQSPTTTTVDNSLDDIFGSSPPPSSEINPPLPTETPAEPSDLPSLRRQHVTAGYRDGISASKGEHVQNGFDAGFPVGGQLGMRAGTVLGILEGVLRGYENRAVVKKQLPAAAAARGNSTGAGANAGRESEEQRELRRNQRERVLKIYQRALKELEVQSVFGVMEDNGDEEKPEAQLARKGDNVISKLEDRVRVAHWEENMEALEEKEKEEKEMTGNGNTERS